MPDATIHCVKCNTELEKEIVYDVEVDVCRQCGGIWLDRGEIAALAAYRDSVLDELRTINRGAIAPATRSKKLGCPACPGTLEDKVIGAVRVDFCPRCQGFHLDRGELDQAVAAARSRGASARHVLALAAKEI
jgi:Zn-finger nucleic acid-binding protein